MSHRFGIRVGASLALALASLSASAGFHQICFEGHPEEPPYVPMKKRIVVAICEDDQGQPCSISARYANGAPAQWRSTIGDPRTVALYPTAPGGAREFQDYYFDASDDLIIDFEFDGGATKRSCTIPRTTRRIPEGRLTSFSTDRSGLATTGVWKFSARDGSWAPPVVPEGFVVVGGGAAALQPDAFIARANERGTPATGWNAYTYTELGGVTHQVEGYAIGLRIANIPETLLPVSRSVLGSYVANPSNVAAPSVRAPASPLPGVVSLGGGILSQQQAGARLFVAASAPVPGREFLVCATRRIWPVLCPNTTVNQWLAEAKHPSGQALGSTTASLSHLPDRLDVEDPVTGAKSPWRLEVTLRTARAAADLNPGATATGLRGDWALVGAGGEVDWSTPTSGNTSQLTPLMSVIEPRADLGGAVAKAQPGSAVMATPVTLAAHAVGLRLVDPKSDVSFENVPEILWSHDFCRVETKLGLYKICTTKPRWLSPKQMCQAFSELGKFGFCAEAP